MRYILLLLSFSFVTVYSQNSEILKSEIKGSQKWEYFIEKDSSIKIRISDLNDRLLEIRSYSDITENVEHGEWIEFYSNGNKKRTRYFNYGEPILVWEKIKKNGTIKSTIDYDFDLAYSESDISVFNQDSSERDTTDKVYVTKMPSFNDGDLNTFRIFVQQNLRIAEYNFDSYNGSGIHKIFVRFTVDSTGQVNDIFVNDHGKRYMEKEAARAVRQSPLWSPGIMHDKPVKVQFAFPVVFVYP